MDLDEELKALKNAAENLKKRVRLLEDMRISRLKKLLAWSRASEEDKNLQEQIDRIEALRQGWAKVTLRRNLGDRSKKIGSSGFEPATPAW